MLFRSCAIPPANFPTTSIFWMCRNCRSVSARLLPSDHLHALGARNATQAISPLAGDRTKWGRSSCIATNLRTFAGRFFGIPWVGADTANDYIVQSALGMFQTVCSRLEFFCIDSNGLIGGPG